MLQHNLQFWGLKSIWVARSEALRRAWVSDIRHALRKASERATRKIKALRSTVSGIYLRLFSISSIEDAAMRLSKEVAADSPAGAIEFKSRFADWV